MNKSKLLPEKQYLGDAVYAEIMNYGELILTTEDGISATNRIVLEPQVIKALDLYLLKIKEVYAARAEEEEKKET